MPAVLCSTFDRVARMMDLTMTRVAAMAEDISDGQEMCCVDS